MSLTSNQGLIVADPTDVNDVPASFTELLSGGATPSAGLENRLVQRYLSSVDRTARNPTPNEGELSYLIDTNAYETYNGSAWVAVVKGFVGETTRVVNSASFTTTETLLDQITFTAVAGLRYKFSWNGNLRTGVAADTGRVIFRYQAGGTLTSAGTLFYVNTIAFATGGATGAKELTPFKTVTGIAAGTTSIGVLAIRDTGTGSWTSVGSATQQVYSLLETV